MELLLFESSWVPIVRFQICLAVPKYIHPNTSQVLFTFQKCGRIIYIIYIIYIRKFKHIVKEWLSGFGGLEVACWPLVWR